MRCRDTGLLLVVAGALLAVPVADAATRKRNNADRTTVAAATTRTAAPAASKEASGLQAFSPSSPLVAVASLSAQSISIFSGTERIAQSPISSGMSGYATPTGVFSILQRNRHHESNIYSGAPMPYMQRLTWSGIALHEGNVPGYPASHGCVRLPSSFAQKLWGMGRVGMRVIISPEQRAPTAVEHGNLLQPLHSEFDGAAAGERVRLMPQAAAERERRRAVAALSDARAAAVARFDEARKLVDQEAAARTELEDERRGVALVRTHLDRAQGMARVALTEEDQGQAAASVSIVEEALAETNTRIATLQAELARRTDAAFEGARVARAAETAVEQAETALKLAQAGVEPVSVYVSRKLGRLFVRQGFQPVLEADLVIRDGTLPIGTHVFTASTADAPSASVGWTAVSISDGGATLSAAAALDRIEWPAAVRDEIARKVWAGASLIISDQGLSPETGKGTDFVVLTR